MKILQAILIVSAIFGAILIDQSVKVKKAYSADIEREAGLDKMNDKIAPSEIKVRSCLRWWGWAIIVVSALAELGLIFFA